MDRKKLPPNHTSLWPKSETGNHTHRRPPRDRQASGSELWQLQEMRRNLPSKGFHRSTIRPLGAQRGQIQGTRMLQLPEQAEREDRSTALWTMRLHLPIRQKERQKLRHIQVDTSSIWPLKTMNGLSKFLTIQVSENHLKSSSRRPQTFSHSRAHDHFHIYPMRLLFEPLLLAPFPLNPFPSITHSSR